MRVDTLLCHDDKLEGRRIAFILYLVPEDWSEEDGGHLELYGVNGEKVITDLGNVLFSTTETLMFGHSLPPALPRSQGSAWQHQEAHLSNARGHGILPRHARLLSSRESSREKDAFFVGKFFFTSNAH